MKEELIMKFISFNVNGLRAILKKDFEKTFDDLNADIFSLNETKLSDDAFPFQKEGYEIFYTNSKVKKGYSGVAVFSKIKPLSVHYGLIDNLYDEEGRVITLEFDNFFYVACYVPNSGENLKRLDFRLEFEKNLVNYLNSLKEKKHVVYAGDLNVAHEEIDIKNPATNHHNAGFTDEERAAFSALLKEGYIDTYRYLHPEQVEYSWWSYRFNARKNNAGWRIDYFLIDEGLKDKLLSSCIHTDIMGSDHCPIELNLSI